MFDSKILLQAICGDPTWIPFFPGILTAAPEALIITTTLPGVERGKGLPSEFCKYCSSNRRYRAWISCKAELGDTSGTDLRKCLPLVHQRPYSINQKEHSTDSDGCLEQKTGTGQSTGHPVQQSHGAQLTASLGSANASRKREKTHSWTRRASCFEKSLGILPKLQQKEASFAGRWRYPMKSRERRR